MSNVQVINGGFVTTIQDAGRYGYQEIGIGVGGFADDYNARIANLLVGNDPDEALLEMTYLGVTLKFDEAMLIAITGADFGASINNEPIENNRSYLVQAGDTLKLGKANNGIRGYLAFSGQIDVPVVNGSKSTQIKFKMGGYEGRVLRAKDALEIIVNPNITGLKELPEKYIEEYSHTKEIRVVMGPQDDYFTEEGIKNFLSPEGYTITKEFDRMGIRLEGPKIELKDKADIISDGTVLGSIQVPQNGQPIILSVDRQTTGGYTKIATIISSDFHKLGNLGFEDRIIFKEVSVEEANRLAREYSELLKNIARDL